jgi:hypothetical protein
VYRMLHNLGTEETKQHIREMNILNWKPVMASFFVL